MSSINISIQAPRGNHILLLLVPSLLLVGGCNSGETPKGSAEGEKSVNKESRVKTSDQKMDRESDYEVESFRTDVGWGYAIQKDGKKYIQQEHIPAIQGVKGFDSEEDARDVATLMIHKMKKDIFPPTVTIEELDSLGVLPTSNTSGE